MSKKQRPKRGRPQRRKARSEAMLFCRVTPEEKAAYLAAVAPATQTDDLRRYVLRTIADKS